MLGKTLASPLLTFNSTVRFCSYVNLSLPDSASLATCSKQLINVNPAAHIPRCIHRCRQITTLPTSRKWELHSTAQIQDTIVTDEDKSSWESCGQALSAFGFSKDEQDRILGKAFGQIHSPYWGEERKKEIPKVEIVSETISYLKEFGLTDEDLVKLLKKFPEVLGCSLENEVKPNVGILEKEWGIKGKTLRNLLLRNPKVLGYNIDCKGDCMAQCTRCWVRF